MLLQLQFHTKCRNLINQTYLQYNYLQIYKILYVNKLYVLYSTLIKYINQNRKL